MDKNGIAVLLLNLMQVHSSKLVTCVALVSPEPIYTSKSEWVRKFHLRTMTCKEKNNLAAWMWCKVAVKLYSLSLCCLNIQLRLQIQRSFSVHRFKESFMDYGILRLSEFVILGENQNVWSKEKVRMSKVRRKSEWVK